MGATSYTPFQEAWWLEASGASAWDEVQIERGGEVVARLPFTVEERFGARVLTQPALTQSLGPWIKSTGGGYTRTLGREMSLYGDLIKGLPEHDAFQQHFAPQVTNWLPFYWEGFTQTTRYTYVLDLTQSLDELWAGMDKRNRSRVRKASRELEVSVHCQGALDTLLDVVEMTFARQGLKMPYTREYVHRLDEAIQANSRRWIVVARDKTSGVPHAANYTFGDEGRVYALLSGADPDLRNSGAGVAARWEAIRAVHPHTGVFDFEGSMIPGVEHRNRKYGAHQVPYFSLSRSNGVFERGRDRQERRRKLLAPLWAAKQRVFKA